jgi:hypothetical protein
MGVATWGAGTGLQLRAVERASHSYGMQRTPIIRSASPKRHRGAADVGRRRVFFRSIPSHRVECQ